MTSYTRADHTVPINKYIGIVAPTSYFNKDSDGNYLDEFGHIMYSGCEYRDLLAKKTYVLFGNTWYEQ